MALGHDEIARRLLARIREQVGEHTVEYAASLKRLGGGAFSSVFTFTLSKVPALRCIVQLAAVVADRRRAQHNGWEHGVPALVRHFNTISGVDLAFT